MDDRGRKAGLSRWMTKRGRRVWCMAACGPRRGGSWLGVTVLSMYCCQTMPGIAQGSEVPQP